MRFAKVNVLVVVCLVLASPVLSQSVPAGTASVASPTRDAQALAIVQLAVTASGGSNALSAVQSAIATGSISPSSSDSWVIAGNFRWENDLSGGTYEFRDEFVMTDGSKQLFASGHGKPAFNNGKVVSDRSQHMAFANPPYHLPGLLLYRELANTNYSIQLVETIKNATGTVVHIRTSIAGGPVENTVSQQDWYIDAGTGLPLRVVYRLPSNNNVFDFITTTLDYSGYQTVAGVTVPLALTTSENDIPICTATISTINFNVAISATDFDLSTGGTL